MIKHGYEEIDIQNPLKNKLTKLVNYFVKFYGEKHRGVIENRIENTIFLFLERATNSGTELFKTHFEQLKSKAKSPVEKKYLENEEARLLESISSSDAKKAENNFLKKRNDLIFDYVSKNLEIEDNEYNREVMASFSDLYSQFVTTDRVFYTDNDWVDYKRMFAVFLDLGKWDFQKLPRKIAKGMDRLSMPKYTKEIKEAICELEDERNEEMLFDDKFSENVDEIRSYDLLEGEIIIDFLKEFTVGLNGIGGAQYTTVLKKNPKQAKNVCINNSAIDLSTASFVHECVHAVTSNCFLDKGKYYSKCGFNYYIAQFIESRAKIDRVSCANWKRYDAINEIATDYQANQIFQQMKKDGFKIGFIDDEPNAYSGFFPIFNEFFETYLKDIKDCFISEEPAKFAKLIGEENFNALADFSTDFLNFCIENNIDSSIEQLIRKECGKKEEYFDIFDVGFDISIKWKNPMLEKYMLYIREASEIFSRIEDYVEGYDENDFDFAGDDDDEYDDEYEDDEDDGLDDDYDEDEFDEGMDEKN